MCLCVCNLDPVAYAFDCSHTGVLERIHVARTRQVFCSARKIRRRRSCCARSFCARSHGPMTTTTTQRAVVTTLRFGMEFAGAPSAHCKGLQRSHRVREHGRIDERSPSGVTEGHAVLSLDILHLLGETVILKKKTLGRPQNDYLFPIKRKQFQKKHFKVFRTSRNRCFYGERTWVMRLMPTKKTEFWKRKSRLLAFMKLCHNLTAVKREASQSTGTPSHCPRDSRVQGRIDTNPHRFRIDLVDCFLGDGFPPQLEEHGFAPTYLVITVSSIITGFPPQLEEQVSLLRSS